MSATILAIKQIGPPLRGPPILLITRMITDRIGLHSVLLPLSIAPCTRDFSVIFLRWKFEPYQLVRYQLFITENSFARQKIIHFCRGYLLGGGALMLAYMLEYVEL